MAVSPDFRDFVLEMLEPFSNEAGPVTFRPMFGGGGLYRSNAMFALITRTDVLYFRTDERNKPDYEMAGMGPFITNAEKQIAMPYHEVPADVLENSGELCAWARKALDAVLRAHKDKPKKTKKPRRS